MKFNEECFNLSAKLFENDMETWNEKNILYANDQQISCPITKHELFSTEVS